MNITDRDESHPAESAIIRHTYSVCPVCLKKVPATLQRTGDGVFLMKRCPEHGEYSARVWADKISLEEWISGEEPLVSEHKENEIVCSGDCRSCVNHGQGSCCVILEVTKRCNLRCTYCFAYGGESQDEPSFDELCEAIEVIAAKGGGPLLQLSGGEPTLREDLPELVKYARDAGCRYTQINTNGIRLAEDEAYVKRLAEAGLDIVFLQFDGTEDEIYRKLRGRDFLDIKLRAIEYCNRYRIGVTLVPTVVRGVNDKDLGNIIRKAVELFPAVKSVHFQPVTYLGRRPGTVPEHYTLDELMADMCIQTGIPESSLLPSRCDHAMCEFHSTFMLNGNRQLVPVSERKYYTRHIRTSAERNREYVACHWGRSREEDSLSGLPELDPDIPLVSTQREDLDFDEFSRMMRSQTIKISAMAFQDAMNIDLERLSRCSLHVYEEGKLLPFCAKYLTGQG